MSIGVDPPPPVPAGFVPLNDCIGYLAVRNGDGRFVNPVTIWRHSQTGEIRTEPPLLEMREALLVYTNQILAWLRAGYLTAFVDGPDQTLAPSFWQYPVAQECVQKGSWKTFRLFASRDELEEIAENLAYLIEARAREVGGADEPKAEDVLEHAEQRSKRRGPKIKHFWAKTLGQAAAWLASNGMPDNQTKLEEFILTRIENMGQSAEPSQVRVYANELFNAFREEMADKADN